MSDTRSQFGSTVVPSTLLRYALVADAAVSGAMAILQVTAADRLSRWTALPVDLLFETGLFFILYAAALVVLARSARLSSTVVLAVVLGNTLWAVACAALLLLRVVDMNGLGVAFVLVQIDAVLVFAALQWRGLRRSSPAHLSNALAG